MNNPIDVGFVYPVIEKKIYVGQRGTAPYKGLYGPIGGKAEELDGNQEYFPYIKDFPAHPHIPKTDSEIKLKNKEYGHIAAIRELYEEAFQIKVLIEKDIYDLFKIGSISDSFNNKETNCQFYIANINKIAFNPSPRELTDIKPLEDISQEKLYPLAKATLYGLKKAILKGNIKKLETYNDNEIIKQIPDFDPDEIQRILINKHTTIEGLFRLFID